MDCVPTFSDQVLTADGLAKVTMSIVRASVNFSSLHSAGKVVYVFSLVTYMITPNGNSQEE